jgi:hypothetical protein
VTAAVPAVLPPRLLGWLEHVLDGQMIHYAERLAGGYSNDTSLIVTGAGRYVLRRYARASRCAVEAALTSRLRGAVPVAEVVAADPDGTDAGEPVSLSDFVSGSMLSQALAAGTDQDAAGLGSAAGAVLAAIGSEEFSRAGFFGDAGLNPKRDDSGPPGGCLSSSIAACGTATRAMACRRASRAACGNSRAPPRRC